MIACPSCGSETSVLETRVATSYARRRRICKSIKCGEKITTMEVVIHNPRNDQGGEIVMVRRDQLARLIQMASRMLAASEVSPPPSSQEDEPCPD